MIWDIADEFPFYGYRRVMWALRRRGLRVNHKRVRRIMGEEGLRAIRTGCRGQGAGYRGQGAEDRCRPSRSSAPMTTASAVVCGAGGRAGRERRIVEGEAAEHPNLVPGLKIDRPDQVWAADMTCIELESEFVFLAVIIDLFTRRCIGWSLGGSADAGHIHRALRKALRTRGDGKDLRGLIHHSDHGFVYADREYGELLASRGIRMSMGERGDPYDNARVERFFRTLKQENICLNEYAGYEDALEDIEKFIEEVYNTKRLHSALGYRTPAEFEELEEAGAAGPG